MTNLKRFRILFSKIKDNLNFLPTNDEKKAIIEGLREIIGFLEGIKDIFVNMPSLEEAEKARDALVKLDEIFERNPLVRDILFGVSVRKKDIGSIKPEKKIEISDEDIEKELESLKKLSEQEIKNFLNNEKKYPKSLLIAIAKKLGGRVSSKITRKHLIENIATIITNVKTYEGLMRGGE